MKPLCILVATVLLAGCAAPKVNTASGLNEVQIAAKPAVVKTHLIGSMAARGYVILQADEFVVMGERPAGTAADVLFGTGMNPNTKIKAVANLIPVQDETQVIMRAYLIDGYRSESPLPARPETQTWLEEFKAKCEAK